MRQFTTILVVLLLTAFITCSSRSIEKYDLFDDLADKLSIETFEQLSDSPNPGCLFEERYEKSLCHPTAKNVLFSIDISASMNELVFFSPPTRRIDLVIRTIENALLEMDQFKTNQVIYIQLFSDKVRPIVSTFGPIVTDGKSKGALSAINWLKQHTGWKSIDGHTDIKFGLRSALTLFKSNPRNETAIYLMTDGVENREHVIEILPAFNPKESPVVNTILFLKRFDEKYHQLMKSIAKYFGGYFKWSY
ncbi:predicted protein [Naegleria gruberi]|uniref:Predicted protein n=1 Tax=Naegleria gruberi TaxID=5762 RepID=D2V7X3_NAEGR|nr:uncharacterized protein NAEGRDRAFT_64955 [Naegleria gruberi]EFC47082.1 predicted protein [Naegleria gruberi]|eukprot:XP_002679826.1 predicted protein [Naegleria gruberi strain NEG-M]